MMKVFGIGKQLKKLSRWDMTAREMEIAFGSGIR